MRGEVLRFPLPLRVLPASIPQQGLRVGASEHNPSRGTPSHLNPQDLPAGSTGEQTTTDAEPWDTTGRRTNLALLKR